MCLQSNKHFVVALIETSNMQYYIATTMISGNLFLQFSQVQLPSLKIEKKLSEFFFLTIPCLPFLIDKFDYSFTLVRQEAA
jgi:hypothetical protein